MDLLSIAAGAAGVGFCYFLYLVASKGLPAALAWVKAKWTAGKAELAALEDDVAGLKTRLDALESRVAVKLPPGIVNGSAPIATATLPAFLATAPAAAAADEAKA